MKKIFQIKGMHCNSCANSIENALKSKVNNISVSFSKEEANIDFDKNKISEKEIKDTIKKLGYECNYTCEIKNNKTENISFRVWFAIIAFIALVIVALFYFNIINLPKIPEIELPEGGDKIGLGLIFIIGILTGFHCVSMCGGFVVSYTAKNALNGNKGYKQHLVYGSSKVISYTIIGGIFGLIGGIFAFSIRLRAGIVIFAGVFMIFYALSMFGFKFFRKFQINPRFLTKFTMKASANAKGQYRGPIMTGLLNGLFIACGPLQAMYLYAAGTGNFSSGAAALAVFGLGTLPVMIIFGSFTSIVSNKTTKKILKISAVIVLILGLVMLNRGLTMIGSPYSFSGIGSNFASTSVPSKTETILTNGIQEINMNVSASGYSPNSFVIKKGVPIKWNVNVIELTSCNQELILRQYNIDKQLKKGMNVIEFTSDKYGTVPFSCGMGMLHGSFIVTDSRTTSNQQIAQETAKSESSCNMGTNGGSCGCKMKI